MTRDDGGERVEAGFSRRTGGRQDAAARREELLVRRAGGTQCELVRAVAGERGMGVTVDEPRNRREPAAVQLLDIAGERRQVAHRADLLDDPALDQDIRVLEDLDRAECRPAKRRSGARRRRQLGQVANEQAAHESLTT